MSQAANDLIRLIDEYHGNELKHREPAHIKTEEAKIDQWMKEQLDPYLIPALHYLVDTLEGGVDEESADHWKHVAKRLIKKLS